MTLFDPNPMLRSLLFLALAATFVGCKSTPSAGSAASVRFSWEKDVIVAADNTRATVRSVRPEYTLIELSAIEKRDAGARLQLTKAGKAFVVEIIKADDKSAVVSIVAGQANVPEVSVGDTLGLAVLAQ